MTGFHLTPFDGRFGDSNALPYDLLMAELVHRTANDFASASAAVHLAKRSIRDADTIATLDRLSARLEAIAQIQRILLSPKIPVLDLGEALRELCSRMTQVHFAPRGISLGLQVAEVSLDSERAWGLMLIVAELLTNVGRHAYPHGRSGRVSVAAYEEDGVITCTVADEGCGRPPSAATEGCGSSIVDSIAEVIEAVVAFPRCDTGTTVEVQLAARAGYGDRIQARIPWS